MDGLVGHGSAGAGARNSHGSRPPTLIRDCLQDWESLSGAEAEESSDVPLTVATEAGNDGQALTQPLDSRRKKQTDSEP